jgi:hypothetical protein
MRQAWQGWMKETAILRTPVAQAPATPIFPILIACPLSVRDQLPQDALETDAARIGWIRSGPTFARPAAATLVPI